MSHRRRRQALKAVLLDRLSKDAGQFEVRPPEEVYGLTEAQQADVYQELADQLYRWAVRITPDET